MFIWKLKIRLRRTKMTGRFEHGYDLWSRNVEGRKEGREREREKEKEK